MLWASIMVGNPPPASSGPQYGRYTSVPIVLVAGIAVCVALLARWRAEFTAHRRRVESLQWRIHVNGIRGKSTVTRIIAGMLREAGYVTIAKSTGTFAAVINRDGVDEPIDRRGPPTILEQIEVTRSVPDARCRCARDRVHGAQARVPGGERADDRPLEHRRAHQRPRGPPGRDGRDAPRDRPLAAVDLPPQRSPDHRRAGPGHPRRDARGVRRAGQRAARGRSRARSPTTTSPASTTSPSRRTSAIAIAIAERLGIPREVAMNGIVEADARPRRAADEGPRDRWQAGHVGQPVRGQRSRVDGGRDGEARAVHHRRRRRRSGSSTTAPTASGGRSSSPTSPSATCRSTGWSRSAPTRGWSPNASARTATRPTTSSTSATSTTRRRTRSSTA